MTVARKSGFELRLVLLLLLFNKGEMATWLGLQSHYTIEDPTYLAACHLEISCSSLSVERFRSAGWPTMSDHSGCW